MNAPKVKRRRFLVDSKVQCALGMRIALHWSIFLVATLVITATLRVVGAAEQGNVGETILSALREQLVAIVVIFALLPWFIHDALGLSNLFAGPVVRLRSALRELSKENESQPIQFRDGDFWQDMAEEFNGLRERVLSDRAELEDLRADSSHAEGCCQWHSSTHSDEPATIPLVQSAPLILVRSKAGLAPSYEPLEL